MKFKENRKKTRKRKKDEKNKKKTEKTLRDVEFTNLIVFDAEWIVSYNFLTSKRLLFFNLRRN